MPLPLRDMLRIPVGALVGQGPSEEQQQQQRSTAVGGGCVGGRHPPLTKLEALQGPRHLRCSFAQPNNNVAVRARDGGHHRSRCHGSAASARSGGLHQRGAGRGVPCCSMAVIQWQRGRRQRFREVAGVRHARRLTAGGPDKAVCLLGQSQRIYDLPSYKPSFKLNLKLDCASTGRTAAASMPVHLAAVHSNLDIEATTLLHKLLQAQAVHRLRCLQVPKDSAVTGGTRSDDPLARPD